MAYNDKTTASVGTEEVRKRHPAFSCNETVTLESNAKQPDELVTLAQQLLSETAHDLQSPLMAVRESVRLVNDGELGEITGEQHNTLLGAIQGCSDMQELIDNMLRLEGLRSGMPRVHRQWIDAATIVQSVSATITSAGLDKEVTVLWDMPSNGHHLLYADSTKLRRLLLNLLRNAIRATPSGGQVMVRTEAIKARGTFRFSVIDRGCGMDPDALRRLAVRGSSSCGSAGLGLAISRQMAAIHFGNLEITSRPDRGTRVRFEVSSAGPSAVADNWCRWRDLFRLGPARPSPRGVHTPRMAEENHGAEREAIFSEGTLVLSHEGPAPQHPDSVTALSLQLAESTPIALATRVDERLQEGLRIYELAYRAAERRWVMLWDADCRQAIERIADTNRSIAASLPAVRSTWSPALQLPIGARSTRASIRDLLVRDTLGGRNQLPIGDDRRMAMGETAIQSGTDGSVTRRLDQELRRLTAHLGQQRTLMQQQAAAIRPPHA